MEMCETIREIVIEWPTLGISVVARETFKNLKYFDMLWKILPLEAIQSHAVVSGDLMYCWEPVLTTEEPENQVTYKELEEGEVSFSPDINLVCIKYGPVTETMLTAPIAQVREEDKDKLKVAGDNAWNALCYSKRLIKVIFKRAE